MIRSVTAALLLSAALASSAQAKEIERYNPSNSFILQGVSVPAGSDTLYLSGMLASPVDPAKATASPMTLTMDDFGNTNTQATSVFTKMKAALESHGYTMADVIKLTVFVAGDPKLGGKMDFKGFNDAYLAFFGTAENPNKVARSTVQVAALAGPPFLVEIEATAAKAPTVATKKK